MTTQETIVNHVRYRFSTVKLTVEGSLQRSETLVFAGKAHGGTSILSVVCRINQGLAASERADAGVAPVTSW
jgi:hypothetical protein